MRKGVRCLHIVSSTLILLCAAVHLSQLNSIVSLHWVFLLTEYNHIALYQDLDSIIVLLAGYGAVDMDVISLVGLLLCRIQILRV